MVEWTIRHRPASVPGLHQRMCHFGGFAPAVDADVGRCGLMVPFVQWICVFSSQKPSPMDWVTVKVLASALGLMACRTPLYISW